MVSHCVGQQGGNGSAPGQQTEQPQQEDEDDEEEEGTEGQIYPFIFTVHFTHLILQH
jgi:hypothetical protein